MWPVPYRERATPHNSDAAEAAGLHVSGNSHGVTPKLNLMSAELDHLDMLGTPAWAVDGLGPNYIADT